MLSRSSVKHLDIKSSLQVLCVNEGQTIESDNVTLHTSEMPCNSNVSQDMNFLELTTGLHLLANLLLSTQSFTTYL